MHWYPFCKPSRLLGLVPIFKVSASKILGFHVTSQYFPNMGVRHICAPRSVKLYYSAYARWINLNDVIDLFKYQVNFPMHEPIQQEL